MGLIKHAEVLFAKREHRTSRRLQSWVARRSLALALASLPIVRIHSETTMRTDRRSPEEKSRV